MKKLFSILILFFCTLDLFGQTILDHSMVQKKSKDGIELTFYEGLPVTGVVTEKYQNGKPKSWQELKDGVTNGLWQEWYENGQLKFNAYWMNGKGHGLWEYYHQNGVLRQEEFYNMDIPVGIFRVFYTNGQLKSKSSWLNGKKHGSWTFYSENGILSRTEQYEDGKLLSTTPSSN
ncbi:MAG: toxin-antitoxin system YwqK family antitoxin [Bacteroidetes Order II. Incertae sedis bacterium]|nr:toxin-antitoxin system YwqK family antitoxin [Bacteroidetes Order II. bacterium]